MKRRGRWLLISLILLAGFVAISMGLEWVFRSMGMVRAPSIAVLVAAVLMLSVLLVLFPRGSEAGRTVRSVVPILAAIEAAKFSARQEMDPTARQLVVLGLALFSAWFAHRNGALARQPPEEPKSA